MKNITRVFLYREYLLIGNNGGIRIDEEAIFCSFEDAQKFITSLQQKDLDIASQRSIRFRTEIIEYILDQTEEFTQRWIYSMRGELIEHEKECNLDTPAPVFNNSFNIGDLIYIKPKIFENSSPSINGTFGVIVECPGNVNTKNGLDSEYYTVYFINDFGLLAHLHAKECALASALDIPEEYKISNFTLKAHEE